MSTKSNELILHVWGDYACFTRPEFKVERVSYEVMTPSAAKGIVESIYWKPRIEWIITNIHVQNHIVMKNIKRNEISSKIKISQVNTSIKNGLDNFPIYVEDERQQRNSLILSDVDYFIRFEARMLSDKEIIAKGCKLENNSKERNECDMHIEKHLEMFRQRASKGKCYHQPVFGCREFAANFDLYEDPIPPSKIIGTQKLGFILYDMNFADPQNIRPRYFNPIMIDGIIDTNPKTVEIKE